MPAEPPRSKLWSRLRWSAYLAGHMRGQAKWPFRSIEAILRRQQQRLREIVQHAYETVPYYRRTMDELRLRPEDFHDAADLARLPIIEPADLQRRPMDFVSTARPVESYVYVRSGGSTGDPRVVYHTSEEIFQNAANGERERGMVAEKVGRRFGYRETILISLNSTAEKLQGFAASRGLLPKRLRIERQYLSLLDPPEKNVPLMNEFRPDVIHTYGSYLEILFSYLARTGAAFHRPKVVTYSSDGLGRPALRLIEQEFGIPVLGTYQASEAFKIGFDCPHHAGLHLNIDLYPVRIVDATGADRPAGETGDVAISNLVNRATVLLNYRLGDLAAMLREPCPCGRTLPLLSYPPGRSDDLIRLPSGQIVHPQQIRTLFAMDREVLQYQVVQQSESFFDVRIVPFPGADRAALERRIAAEFARRLGGEIHTEVRAVDSIERTAAGKFRPVISACSQTRRQSLHS